MTCPILFPSVHPHFSLTAVHTVGPQQTHEEQMKDWAGSAHDRTTNSCFFCTNPFSLLGVHETLNTGALMPRGEPTGGTCIPVPGGRSDLESQRTSLATENHCPCYPKPSLLGPRK